MDNPGRKGGSIPDGEQPVWGPFLTGLDWLASLEPMTRSIVCILTVLTLGLGCQSGNSGKPGKSAGKQRNPFFLKSDQKNRDGEHGLKYYEGIGWRYIKPGLDVEVLTYTNTQLLEYARKAMKEERYDDAKFAANYFIQRTPGADDVPVMRRVVAEVFEKRGLEEYAFKEYQKLLSAHPGYEKTDEVTQKMYEIATLYLGGKSFRWKLPWQDTLYIPTGSSMTKTSKLYTQIVTNAPFGAHAAQSQYGIGQAHEKALEGFWGIFASSKEYDRATRAYQLLADRYSSRVGDLPRPNQKEIDKMVAQARFRTAELFEKQANEGIYDQSMSERSISAFGDYVELYNKEPELAEEVSEAQGRINAMRLERARGLKAIALFYEKNRQWVAAQTYYGQINQTLFTSVLNDPKHQEEAQSIQEFANKRLSEELFQWRLKDALKQYAEAQEVERKNKPYTAQRLYRKAGLNLDILPNDMERAAKAVGLDLKRLKDTKVAVDKDLDRIQKLLDQREVERFKNN